MFNALPVINRDARGTSPAWVGILLIGFLLWLSYGLIHKAAPLIITNAVSVLVGLALIATIATYPRRRAHHLPLPNQEHTDS